MQLEGMFDVPAEDKLTKSWNVDLPIEDDTWPPRNTPQNIPGKESDADEDLWRVGLIVGPSGAGKSQIARRAFGDAVDRALDWDGGRSVLDNFDERLGIKAITEACTAVGFNTVPSWLKPFHVLSNGEQFRVALARRLAEATLPPPPEQQDDRGSGLVPDLPGVVVIDEFTSVVDRQVAKIGSHAVQKFVRTHTRHEGSPLRFVGVTCHYDVTDWLRPDWLYDPSEADPERRFAWGSVRRGGPRGEKPPGFRLAFGPLDAKAWSRFAPFHYMNAQLNNNARAWGLWVAHPPEDGAPDTAQEQWELAAFAGVVYQMVAKRLQRKPPIMRIARMVTLPDYQGLGLAYRLIDRVAEVYKRVGCSVTIHPAHPAATRALDLSPRWACLVKPGKAGATLLSGDSVFHRGDRGADGKRRAVGQGGRPCATFRYAGPPAYTDGEAEITGASARAILAAGWSDGGLGPVARRRCEQHQPEVWA